MSQRLTTQEKEWLELELLETENRIRKSNKLTLLKRIAPLDFLSKYYAHFDQIEINKEMSKENIFYIKTPTEKVKSIKIFKIRMIMDRKNIAYLAFLEIIPNYTEIISKPDSIVEPYAPQRRYESETPDIRLAEKEIKNLPKIKLDIILNPHITQTGISMEDNHFIQVFNISISVD